MNYDPPRGTTCAREGCDKPPCQPPTHGRAYVGAEVFLADPFCTAACCREHYRVDEKLTDEEVVEHGARARA